MKTLVVFAALATGLSSCYVEHYPPRHAYYSHGYGYRCGYGWYWDGYRCRRY